MNTKMTTLFLRCDACGFTATEPVFHDDEAECWVCPRCHNDESAIEPVTSMDTLVGRQVQVLEMLEVPGRPYTDHKGEIEYEPTDEYEEHESFGVVTGSHLGPHYFAIVHDNGVLEGWPIGALRTLKVHVVGTGRDRDGDR